MSENVPNLRFPEFNGKWEKKEAKEIFENHSNKDHNGDLPLLAVTQNKGVVRRDTIDIKINTSPKSVLSYKVIEPGDFVISLRSFQGGIEYSSIKGISSPAYTILKPKIKISDNFFKFYLKKEEFISRLSSAVIGIRDGKQISYNVFSEMKLPYTSVEEQEKIGLFLSKIDEKIEKLEEKQQLWETYKKGMMQQLFSQELRFKDNEWNDYPDWKEKRLGNILSKIFDFRGKTPKKLGMEWGGSIPALSAKNVEMGRINLDKETYYGSPKLYQKWMSKGECEFKDIIMTMEAPLGNIAQIPDNKKYILSQRVVLLKVNKKDVVKDYLAQFLRSERFRVQLNKYASGTTSKGIQQSSLKKLNVGVPTSLEEQKKIATFLSNIDLKIERINKDLELNKKFKKGLLQQMFC